MWLGFLSRPAGRDYLFVCCLLGRKLDNGELSFLAVWVVVFQWYFESGALIKVAIARDPLEHQRGG